MITTRSGETVLLEDVVCYHHRAEGPLVSTFNKLRSIEGGDEVVEMIQDLYPRLVPRFIASGTTNPVHHTAYVMEFMATILSGEGERDPRNVRIGMLAALFHDAALGLSKLPKITEEHIENKFRDVVTGKATMDDLKKYVEDAVKARKEHMEEGAKLAGEMLAGYPSKDERMVSDDEIEQIKEIVRHHDDPKIPLTYKVVKDMMIEKNGGGKESDFANAWHKRLDNKDEHTFEELLKKADDPRYRIGPDNGLLLQYHHQADLLWMVTQDGIVADLARSIPGERKTPLEMLEHNVKTHRNEDKLYTDKAGFPDDPYDPKDLEHVFSSKTGRALWKHLTTLLRDRYEKDRE
jgi:hypothetical protein